jgi:hydrophobic/amphiphilic exporter-1 (mainly G- bacteria), HAE1 family
MNLASISIRRPVFATMMIAAIMVFGILAYPKIGVDLRPDVEFPLVTVSVRYPGTDPLTMEREVGEKIEEAVNSLGGIRSLKSYNLESVSMVIIEFELEMKAAQVVQDVRDKVARIEDDLPEDAEKPVIEKMDLGAQPIIYLALSGDMPPAKLAYLADKTVKERLQRIQGVGSVELMGNRERELQVYIDPDKLNGLGLTVADVANTVASQNVEVPAGSFESGTNEFTVKTKGQLKTAEDIANIILPLKSVAPGANPGDSKAQPVVRVSDVANVFDGVREARSSSTLNGKSAISLSITKQSGSNAVMVAEQVHAAVAELIPQVQAKGANLTIATDTSEYIKRSIDDAKFDLVFGAGLAVVVIFFFLLNLRATIISAVAIPTSVIATFAFIHAMGFTFNMLTMLALTIAIGVLIDDAIVVMENIHRHLETGKGSLRAAEDATNEIALAVISMTSTIIAVFVPVAIMKGIVGRFFLQFGLTVAFAVAMSMFVSFTLTPMMSSRLLSAHNAEGMLAKLMDRFMGFLESGYSVIIRWALRNKALTVIMALAALVGSGFMISRVPTEFFPLEDKAQFQVTVELPTGTSLETTTKFLNDISDDILKNGKVVVNTLATVGGGSLGQVNKGSIQVKMTPSKTRKGLSQFQLMAWFRQRYTKMAPAIITVSEISDMGGGSNSQPVQFTIRGKDLDELVAVSEKVRDELKNIRGFVDVDTTYRGGKPEVSIHVDRERAAALNVPVASIASAVRALMAGDAVSELKDGTDSYDIIVQLPKNQRQRIETLSSLKVRSQSGELVDLANLVTVEHGTGPNRIDRSARQREVTVLANLEDLPLGEAQKKVSAVASRVVPKHLTTEFAGMGKIMIESFGYMKEAMVLAVILVYMILAAQFNSFIQPITIMVSLPFSFIGAFGGLYFSGMTLSMLSMIGMIMLMGLVTKNAILLVDFANQARERGTSVHDALVEAGALRLRPILMTTVAMVFGMLPVALALGEGGEARAPMAVCVIGGLITSTLLTLVVIPVVYALFDSLMSSRVFGWLGRKIFTHTGDSVPPGPQEEVRSTVS